MIGNKSKENNLKSIEKKNEDDQSDANEDLDNELKDALFSEKKLVLNGEFQSWWCYSTIDHSANWR